MTCSFMPEKIEDAVKALQYRLAFEEASSGKVFVTHSERYNSSLFIKLSKKNYNETVDDAIKNLNDIIREMDIAAQLAVSDSGRNALRAIFSFPEEIRIPCEQYLLYFGQFLRDVGIKVTTDLTHDAGIALFTVTPSEPYEALDAIHRALIIYLRMPSLPDTLMAQPKDELEVRRMAVEIQNFRRSAYYSQFVQDQLATIQSQQQTINQLAASTILPSWGITPDAFVQSVREIVAASKDTDGEKVLGEVVTIGDIEIKNIGIKISLAQIYRSIRNYVSNHRVKKTPHRIDIEERDDDSDLFQ